MTMLPETMCDHMKAQYYAINGYKHIELHKTHSGSWLVYLCCDDGIGVPQTYHRLKRDAKAYTIKHHPTLPIK